MARLAAWHAVNSDRYHVCSNCHLGNNIERENRRDGTGNNTTMCDECARLIREGAC